jgi:hypothetical protein
MLAILEMEKCPELLVTLKDDMPTPATVTAIRPSFGIPAFATKMSRTCTTFAGATTNFYVINKILFGHNIPLTTGNKL